MIFSVCPGNRIIRNIIREADMNNDGMISFEEFVNVMKKYVSGAFIKKKGENQKSKFAPSELVTK